MLKHVQISPHRNRSDSLSLRSSTSCASSLCGSPEPPLDQNRTPSRASSYCSLNEAIPQTTIKVYTSCLRLDIEYKTLGIQWDTTSKEVVAQLLRRCKMRQRDPRLFYLSMEVTVRRAGVRTVLVLDDEARPAILQACHPKGDSRFYLQLKPGGVIRVHTSALQPTSQYKSLVISEETTSDELLLLLLSSYNSIEPVERYSLYEVCPGQEYQRKLHPDDLPLRAQNQRLQKGEQCHFLVRKNPHYPRRKQILPPIIEKNASTASLSSPRPSSFHSAGSTECDSMSCQCCPNRQSSSDSDCITEQPYSLLSYKNNDDDTPSNCGVNNNNYDDSSYRLSAINDNDHQHHHYNHNKESICKMCKNNFKSCEFCNKNVTKKLSTRISSNLNSYSGTTVYNPVYNIREIRTVCNSFSSLGIDKKLLEVQHSNTSDTIGLQLMTKNNSVKEVINNNNNSQRSSYGNFIYV